MFLPAFSVQKFPLLLLPIVTFCLSSPPPLVFLTLSPNGQWVNVSVASDRPDGQFLLENAGQSQRMSLVYNISAREASNGSLSGELPQTKPKFIFGAQIGGPTNGGNGTFEYAIRERNDEANVTIVEATVQRADDDANLTVCVFGDYRADMMYANDINLSKYADANNCELILFIGKISWEQRECPLCNNSFDADGTAANAADVGLTFSPYSMLADNADGGHVGGFAKVPSIFGAIGHNRNETSFFDCTELDGVAFIQTTVEVSTVARLGNDSSERFQYVEQYFRETMLMELECKLQELHRRPKRPWILIYLTHPSLINEKETEILSLKDNDRFFEVLNRYKIDLLLSCGVEGMAGILKERQANKPAEQLPPYLGTTMATCLSEKDCQYLVLEVGEEALDWRYQDGAGNRRREGKFDKSTQSADACIPDEIPSITGAAGKNGTNANNE